jgi:hypothetical protein
MAYQTGRQTALRNQADRQALNVADRKTRRLAKAIKELCRKTNQETDKSRQTDTINQGRPSHSNIYRH